MTIRHLPDFSIHKPPQHRLALPEPAAAREWLLETMPDDALCFGSALVIEPRYVAGVINAAMNDGFTIGER